MALTQIDDRGLKTPIDLLDNEKIRLGTGNDLQLYHDNANSYVKDLGTGGLYLTSNGAGVYLQSESGENLGNFLIDGAVNLYYDNVKKFETTSTGATVTGNLNCTALLPSGNLELVDSNAGNVGRIRMGASDDFVLYHGGTDSHIENNTGQLKIASDTLRITNGVVSETQALFTANGAVELYYDNSKKFETTSYGALVSGELQATGANFTDDGQSSPLVSIMADDNNPWGLQIGNSTYSDNASHGWQVYVNNSGDTITYNIGSSSYNDYYYYLNNGSTTKLCMHIDGSAGPSVQLYHNNIKKLSTTADGMCFNSDSAAANALDDYEEGTWTPALSNSGGITIHNAYYTKVGKLCNISAYVTISANSSSGSLLFTGLPFVMANIGYGIGAAYTQNTAGTHVFAQVNKNNSTVNVYKTNGSTILQSDMSGAYCLFSATYRTT